MFEKNGTIVSRSRRLGLARPQGIGSIYGQPRSPALHDVHNKRLLVRTRSLAIRRTGRWRPLHIPISVGPVPTLQYLIHHWVG